AVQEHEPSPEGRTRRSRRGPRARRRPPPTARPVAAHRPSLAAAPAVARGAPPLSRRRAGGHLPHGCARIVRMRRVLVASAGSLGEVRKPPTCLYLFLAVTGHAGGTPGPSRRFLA